MLIYLILISIQYHHYCVFKMVGVAQLVRALVCGTSGWRFKSAHPPPLYELYDKYVWRYMFSTRSTKHYYELSSVVVDLD